MKFLNKKAGMPWWLTRLVIPLAIAIFLFSIVYAVKKEINLNIFKIWA